MNSNRTTYMAQVYIEDDGVWRDINGFDNEDAARAAAVYVRDRRGSKTRTALRYVSFEERVIEEIQPNPTAASE